MRPSASGYTQSAISQQIATLERIVGLRLVERPGGPRPISLTEAGRILVRHADAIEARLLAAKADMLALEAGDAGQLRVGTFQSVGTRILPTLLRRFSEAHPAVEVVLRESADESELLEMIERGELDLTFWTLPVSRGPYDSVELLRDPYVLVVPAGSPLAELKRTPTLKEIALQPLIGFNHCSAMDEVESCLASTGRSPNIVFRSDNNGTVQGLVGAGVGVSVAPLLTVDEDDPRTDLDRPARPRPGAGDRTRLARRPPPQRRRGGVRRARSRSAPSSRERQPVEPRGPRRAAAARALRDSRSSVRASEARSSDDRADR